MHNLLLSKCFVFLSFSLYAGEIFFAVRYFGLSLFRQEEVVVSDLWRRSNKELVVGILKSDYTNFSGERNLKMQRSLSNIWTSIPCAAMCLKIASDRQSQSASCLEPFFEAHNFVSWFNQHVPDQQHPFDIPEVIKSWQNTLPCVVVLSLHNCK